MGTVRFLTILAVVGAILAPLYGSAWASEEDKSTSTSQPLVEFPPFTITLMERNRVRGMFRVSFVLELRNAVSADEVESLRPRLHDAYLTQLNQLAQYRVEPDRAVDASLVANSLQASTDFLLGPGNARVLLQDALVRPQ